MTEILSTCLEHYRRANKKIINLRSGTDKLYYAQGLRDICTALEGFLKHKGYTGSNRDKMEKFASDFEVGFKNWEKTSLFKESIDILLSESPVENMDNGKIFSLTSPDDLADILNFTHVPRGNLVHCKKDLLRDDEVGQRNRNLVEHSFKVLHEILQKAMLDERVI